MGFAGGGPAIFEPTEMFWWKANAKDVTLADA
jgi:hypothetical protein